MVIISASHQGRNTQDIPIMNSMSAQPIFGSQRIPDYLPLTLAPPCVPGAANSILEPVPERLHGIKNPEGAVK